MVINPTTAGCLRVFSPLFFFFFKESFSYIFRVVVCRRERESRRQPEGGGSQKVYFYYKIQLCVPPRYKKKFPSYFFPFIFMSEKTWHTHTTRFHLFFFLESSIMSDKSLPLNFFFIMKRH